MLLCFFYLLTYLFICLFDLYFCVYLFVCLSVCDYSNAVSVSLPCTHSSSFIILEITIWAVAKNKSVGWQWYGISAVRVRDKRVVYPMKLDSWPGNCFISISQYCQYLWWIGWTVGPYHRCLPCIYSGLVSWPGIMSQMSQNSAWKKSGTTLDDWKPINNGSLNNQEPI